MVVAVASVQKRSQQQLSSCVKIYIKKNQYDKNMSALYGIEEYMTWD